MNKDNLIQVNIKLVSPTPMPRPTPTPTPLPTPLPVPASSPSESIDENFEEGIVLTEEERYAYELDMSELLSEERRNEECSYDWHGVKFCE